MRFKVVHKPLQHPPHQCLVTKRADVPIIDFGEDVQTEAFPHVYLTVGVVEKAAKECLEMVTKEDAESLQDHHQAALDRIDELEAELKVKPLLEDAAAESALRELAFAAAGSATTCLLQEDPDLELPTERIRDSVESVLTGLSKPSGRGRLGPREGGLTKMLTTTSNQGETLPMLDAPVRRIDVHVGKILVTTPHVETPDEDTPQSESTVVDSGDSIEFSPPVAGIVVHDIKGSRFTVVYADDPEDAPAPAEPKTERKSKRRASSKAAPRKKAAPRGDTGGGDSGGFESRTVKQLRAEVKKRGLKAPSKANKDQLIEVLRTNG